MPRAFLLLLALGLAGCGGAVGALLATVPPPVEFAGQRPGGVAGLPAAGTWRGTLTVERVTYRYERLPDVDEGTWVLVKSQPRPGSGDAEATVGTAGSIRLRRVGETTDLFAGTLSVSTGLGAETPTVALLAEPGGVGVRYPYILRPGEPTTLTLMPHGAFLSAGEEIVTFDRYWFELTPE